MHRNTLTATNGRKNNGCSKPVESRCLVRRGPSTGTFFDMTYNINIDQKFAIANDLTLTQVSTLAAFMTLPIWSNTVAIDGCIWYQYSEDKMCEDFPLLFGVSKRVYKNITDLCERGFVQLTKLGTKKYVRFTNLCASWNKETESVQKRTNGPKVDQEKSENGPNIGPKTDRHYYKDDKNINNNYKINNNAVTGDLFPEQEIKTKRPRKTAEPACLFDDSKFADFDLFAAQFTGPEFENVDIAYYFHAVGDWSAQKGKKMKDWIATARNFIRGDIEKGKLHRINAGGLSPDALKYLKDMA